MAQSDGGFDGWVLLLAGACAFFGFSNYGWSNSLWYSLQYDVDYDDVQTETKPSDCDFMRAPMGLKDCSYKPRVMVYNADGLWVAGENAPKYGSDTNTGRPIVSYNGGKNWDWFIGATVPNTKPKSVRVFWVKG